ncbi:pepsinogen a2 precursor [Moniliophthora roreri MCA 2997]|uniref:Pepsinogen a2 n=2 Tax=Moniliophthora roreri TaxID=221103 RepID=V2XJ58_MONRO|nr:pepsinogen a2 precursor [Moniliophthora roreri MCA 2997]KAI3607733.1 pepsinogen a2 precursor [Moniliophthora roreri]
MHVMVHILFLLFLHVCHVTATSSLKKGFKIPLHRVPRVERRGITDSVPISNVNEFSYLVDVGVGKQFFPLILDTGSSDLWIVSDECDVSDCATVRRYSPASSKDLSISRKPFHLDYLKGSVSGLVAFETVSMGLFEINPQVLGLVNVIQSMNLASTGNSGILGLSFPTEATIFIKSGSTVLENIFAYLDEPFFAFKLGKNSGPNSPTSSLTFGQLDTTYSSDMSSFLITPVSQAGANDYSFWKLPLQSIIVNNYTLPLSQSSVQGVHEEQIAVLDTGTTLILGPTSDVDSFWAMIGPDARYNIASCMWEIKCNKAVGVQFVLGDKDAHRAFTMDYADVNWAEGGSDGEWCMGGIQANDNVDSGDWLLGDVFLRNVYSIHHGGNSTHPPFIGLLGTMNQSAALTDFRTSRGPDLESGSSSMPHIHGTLERRASLAAPMLYSLVTASGFVIGAASTTLFRARRRMWGFRRYSKSAAASL